MKLRRLFVTGAGGMVGSYVPAVFGDCETALTDIVDRYDALDIRNPSAVMKAVSAARPEVVLHLAAATDVDRCEQEPDWAYHTNAVGTQNVALACQALSIPLVYVSTAGVFWGDKPEPYTEFDEPRPANVYGHSKLAGEHIVMSLLQRYYVVRAGWMIGGGVRDKKFVGKIVRLIDEGKTPLRVVDDKWGSPTYGRDLLGGIRALIETDAFGLYHMTNGGRCSRYEVALALRNSLDRPDVGIEPISSAHFPLPAPRARSEVMRNFKLEVLGFHTMRPWQEALREYVTAELLRRPAAGTNARS